MNDVEDGHGHCWYKFNSYFQRLIKKWKNSELPGSCKCCLHGQKLDDWAVCPKNKGRIQRQVFYKHSGSHVYPSTLNRKGLSTGSPPKQEVTLTGTDSFHQEWYNIPLFLPLSCHRVQTKAALTESSTKWDTDTDSWHSGKQKTSLTELALSRVGWREGKPSFKYLHRLHCKYNISQRITFACFIRHCS